MDKTEAKYILSRKEEEAIVMSKLTQWIEQMGKFQRNTRGHFPDCNPEKCECEKFFLSRD